MMPATDSSRGIEVLLFATLSLLMGILGDVYKSPDLCLARISMRICFGMAIPLGFCFVGRRIFCLGAVFVDFVVAEILTVEFCFSRILRGFNFLLIGFFIMAETALSMDLSSCDSAPPFQFVNLDV